MPVTIAPITWIGSPGSRQHIFELVMTRTLALGVIFVFGFSKKVIDVYIVNVGFQAVFNHCNMNVRLGPLRYIIVMPNLQQCWDLTLLK
jgi:sterol desaturase/sphingolipid hydroxylase (fatty acid hydroxylase superfamily)